MDKWNCKSFAVRVCFLEPFPQSFAARVCWQELQMSLWHLKRSQVSKWLRHPQELRQIGEYEAFWLGMFLVFFFNWGELHQVGKDTSHIWDIKDNLFFTKPVERSRRDN